MASGGVKWNSIPSQDTVDLELTTNETIDSISGDEHANFLEQTPSSDYPNVNKSVVVLTDNDDSFGTMGKKYKSISQLFLSIYVPSFFNVVATSIAVPAIPILTLDTLQGSTAMVGIVISAQGVGKMISNLPIGAMAVKYGDKFTICTGFFLQMVSGFTTAVSPNILCLVLSQMILGVSQSMIQLSRQSYMKTAVPKDMSGRALSLIGGSGRVGGIIGPIWGGFCVSHWSVRVAFMFQCAISLVPLILVTTFLEEIEDGRVSNDAVTTFDDNRDIVTNNAVFTEENEESDTLVGDDGDKVGQVLGFTSSHHKYSKVRHVDTNVHSDSISSSPTSKKMDTSTPPTLCSVFRLYYKSLISISLFALTLVVARTAKDIILPLVSLSCGATPTQVGMVSSSSYLIDSSIFYVSGIIMDQAGRKVNAVASPLFFIAGYLQLAVAVNKETIFSASQSLLDDDWSIKPLNNISNSSISSISSSGDSSISRMLSNSWPNRYMVGDSEFEILMIPTMESMLYESQDNSNNRTLSSSFNSSDTLYVDISKMSSDMSSANHGIDNTVFWCLMIAALVLGFANGLGSGLAMTISSDVAPTDSGSRGHFLGIYRIFCDGGMLAGSLLVGIIADEFTLYATCLVCSGVALGATLQAVFCIEETLPPTTPTSKFFRGLLKCKCS